MKLLILEDETEPLDRLVGVGTSVGFAVTVCSALEEASKLIEQNSFDVIMSDLHTGGRGELQVLKLAKTRNTNTMVIIITDSASVERAVEAVGMGAYRYITKPYRFDELKTLLQQVREQCLMRAELTELRGMVEGNRKSTIIGKSPIIQDVKEYIQKVAPLECTILLEGETGVGKEFFARLIHENSKRADKGFFAINCGSFAEELLSNELFGHEKDAYTGADSRHLGFFETAANGTLLLDEISEMPLTSQVKLLRVLQEGTLMRVGGTAEVKVDVRVIAASNRNLEEQVEAGTFRKDLLYRLNIIRVAIPPLRDRVDDISLFCNFFIGKFSAKYNKAIEAVSDEAMNVLCNYDYPGNVRELINTIERAVILADTNCIELKQLPKHILHSSRQLEQSRDTICTLAEMERRHILRALEAADGNKTQAAKILGIDRITLWRKLK
ncbi:MAG: sigma-54 dependent transcriptional regulator [Proteobacteria bacterium]|nr:sigma-54 dependent transcriptional regulator [Pseudomonadota bacterium]MBU1611735.1 sigma-54 dependent transcriptional regulator [Pseudomonadota bacterium]